MLKVIVKSTITLLILILNYLKKSCLLAAAIAPDLHSPGLKNAVMGKVLGKL